MGKSSAAEKIKLDDFKDDQSWMDMMLYARKAEVASLKELGDQAGTSIPAMFSVFYKFIQNPSTVSLETYKRMVDTDDTCGSGVNFLSLCLASRLGRYKHPSNEITSWVNKRLSQIDGGWFKAKKAIIGSAKWNGMSVTEKVWANTDEGFVPKKLVSLPPSTILFETDRTGEITRDGVLQYQRNWNPYSMGTGVGFFGGAMTTGTGFTERAQPDAFARYGDMPFPIRTSNMANYLCVKIPRQKVIHYANDAEGKFDNPYGRSVLRSAYKHWIMKDAVLQMTAVALARKGTPLTVVFYDSHASVKDENATATSAPINAGKAIKTSFDKVSTDSVIYVPGKKGTTYDFEKIDNTANAEMFVGVLDFLNKSITRSLLIPALIFTTGDGSGSWALGDIHSRVWEDILDAENEAPGQVILDQLVREMIAYNFPRSAWEKDGLGEFTKREFSLDEKEKMMNVFDKGIEKGVIDKDDLKDLNHMRDGLGFDERDEPIVTPLEQDPFGLGGGDGDAFGDGARGGKSKGGAGGSGLPDGHKREGEKQEREEKQERRDGQ